MPNYLEIGKGFIQHLPIPEGCSFSFKLNQKGLDALSKNKPELKKHYPN